MGPSEPQSLLRWGLFSLRWLWLGLADTAAVATPTQTHVRSRAAPPSGRAPSHSRPARLSGLRGPAPPPRHSHIPTTERLPARSVACPARLTSHVESDTCKRRISETDPRPRLRASNYKSQKAAGWPYPLPAHTSGACPGQFPAAGVSG